MHFWNKFFRTNVTFNASLYWVVCLSSNFNFNWKKCQKCFLYVLPRFQHHLIFFISPNPHILLYMTCKLIFACCSFTGLEGILCYVLASPSKLFLPTCLFFIIFHRSDNIHIFSSVLHVYLTVFRTFQKTRRIL